LGIKREIRILLHHYKSFVYQGYCILYGNIIMEKKDYILNQTQPT